eukprot:9190726-Pyramimonas_sp.AAC.1
MVRRMITGYQQKSVPDGCTKHIPSLCTVWDKVVEVRVRSPPAVWVYSHNVPIRHRKRGCILTTYQSHTGSTGIFSRRTNHTQEARVYSHDVPIRHRKRGYILTTYQSDTGSAITEILIHTAPNHRMTPVSHRTRLKVKNTRGIFKVCCISDDQGRRHRRAPTLNS